MHNTASIPWLTAWLVRFLDSLGHKGPEMIAGRDIGGSVAQHLLIGRALDILRLALVNAVLCAAPTVARDR